MSPAVTIVILNWNGKKYLEQFLPTVLASQYDNFKVLLVDNASSDDSIAFVKARFPQVEVLALDKNYGFTEGNNKALPHIKSPYFVLLNNDVEVSPGWLSPLVKTMEEDSKVAACQPKILSWHQKEHFEYAGAAGGWMDKWGYPFARGRVFDTLEQDNGQYDRISPIFWATGACCIIRKAVVDQIGLFEPRFFAHMEEIDFCWRAQNFGYVIKACPESKVWHVGGGTLQQENPRKTFLNARNGIALLIKNLPFRELIPKVYLRLCLDGVWGLRSLLQGKPGITWAIIRAHWSIWRSLRFWLKRRRQTYQILKKVSRPVFGYYRRSIVWQYFIKKKKRFSEIVDPQA